MSTVNWSGGGGGWGSSSPASFRSGAAVAIREQWVRLALLSGEAPELLRQGASAEASKRRAQTSADDADEFLNWIFLFGLMTLVYSLSRYFARRHRLGEFDQRNVGDRIPRPPPRPAEPPSYLRRIDTWCPAKAYSSVLEDFHASNGGGPPWLNTSGGPRPAARQSNACTVEIEMTDRGAQGGPPRGPQPEEEKEGLGQFVESGCAICFEEFNPTVLVRVLPCRHIFHRSCLDTWFQRSAMCPLCMHDYSRPPAPSTASAASRGASRAEASPLATADRFISFRFFSFPGRLRQQR